jgi:outer membrane protein assembly factor BamB
MAALRCMLGLIAVLILPGPQPLYAAPVYPANPFLTDQDVFVSVDGIIRLEHDTLHPVWFALEGLKTDAPVVSRGTVMVGTNAGMFALDIDSGMMRWHIPSADTLRSPAVSDEVAFVSGSDGSIQAVDVEDGQRRWRRSLEGSLFTPAIAGQRLVVGGDKGMLWGLDRTNGRSQWKLPLKSKMAGPPVADENGRIYICTTGAKLISVDSGSGKRGWEQTLTSPGAVIVDSKRLYVGQTDGEVSARNRDTGKVLWKQSFPGLDADPLRRLEDTLVVTTESGDNLFLDPASGEAVTPPQMEEGPKAPEAPDAPVAPDEASEDILVQLTM